MPFHSLTELYSFVFPTCTGRGAAILENKEILQYDHEKGIGRGGVAIERSGRNPVIMDIRSIVGKLAEGHGKGVGWCSSYRLGMGFASPDPRERRHIRSRHL